jgi:acetylornithine/N-succinyldiaminopimelate aminotransferase
MTMMTMQQMIERADGVLVGNYARQPVVMVRGEGSYVWDAEDTRYLDLFSGFGGTVLGHHHPALVEAATKQLNTLWAVGNTFHTQPQVELAERLNRHGFTGQAFFCHSGAEANEAACKLARLRGSEKSPKRWKIITLTRSFHGRTLAMISATGNPKVREGFEPAVPGFVNVEAGDFDALAAAVDDETAGVLLEPIQGEGGVHVYADDYLPRVRRLCDERELTLICDEVWTGCGRTGRWFAHQHSGITPDIMTLGKAIGGGLPVGVMFARPEIAKRLVPGKHGSTLGGNPVCMAVSTAVVDVIERENLVERSIELGNHAMDRLRSEKKLQQKIAAIRGRGLMIGVELHEEPKDLVLRGLQRGVVMNLTAQKVIRLAPPLNIAAGDWDSGLDAVIETIASL